MRKALVLLLTSLAACGSSTDPGHARYNFAVIDGLNQSSTAGAPTLAKPITSQLTRDPDGKFATRVFDFLAPAIAYAQGIVLKGDPVADQIVCGEESAPGEPKVVPLCAYTLADGKAANSVQGGTKAGVYKMRFTAQVPTEMPVKDSTTVTVNPGPMASHKFHVGNSYVTWTSPATFVEGNVQDQYGNGVLYTFVVTAGLAHADGRTITADKAGQGTVDVTVDGQVIASGKLTVGFDPERSWVTLEF